MKNLPNAKNCAKAAIALSLIALASACTTVESPSAAPVVEKKVIEENHALKAAIAAQSDENKARFDQRRPEQTLEFFDIQPGMTVVEALPGRGWYSKILLPYLGQDGGLIGVDYPQALWPNLSFMTPERIEAKKTWVSTWTAQANEWRDDKSATISAFQFEELPSEMVGTADAVLFIRALHNLQRFNEVGGFMESSLKETYEVLKPGGIVGIVQHQSAEDRSDEWANGSNGYLKKSFVVARMQAAGFEFVGESNINENSKDQATEEDNVWRLPPSLSGSKDDAEKRAAMEAIGESNRMTLKFRKPA